MHARPILTALSFLVFCRPSLAEDTLTDSSPSGRLQVRVWLDDGPRYAAWFDGKPILATSVIDMQIAGGGVLSSKRNTIRSHRVTQESQTILSPVPEKRRRIRDEYRLLDIRFKDPFSLQFRVYDDGFAYRLSTSFKDNVVVVRETAGIRFPGKSSVYIPLVTKRVHTDIFHTSFEELYTFARMDTLGKGHIGYSPVLIVPDNGSPKIGITESDLEDYPGMFIGGTEGEGLQGVHAPYPLEETLTDGEFPQWIVTKRAPYIARTRGTRTYPWRVFIVAPEDRDLPGNDLVFRLASPSRLADTDWIRPGNLTDEWITDINLFNVPFRAGLNTASYLYYLDFAKRFGFERIMMDAGWSAVTDLFKPNPAVSMDTILDHSRRQGVGLSMWTLVQTLEKQMDSALDRFQRWGVDLIMTDFFDRDDQKAVNLHHRIAEACAKRGIMVMFHGSFPGKGFERTHPNAVAREGAMGSEYNIWGDKVTPQHDLILPYTRMLAGGFDYEPGILNNANQKGTRPVAGVVTSAGTRCHQLAMFVVYDSPMQIFSGNASEGMREPEFMELIGSLPTVWDETVVIDGKVGEYIVTARRSGDEWYVAGLCDWKPRDIELKFEFLDKGPYRAILCKDGVNADRYAADYILSKDQPLSAQETMRIHMAPGGGFLIRLEAKR